MTTSGVGLCELMGRSDMATDESFATSGRSPAATPRIVDATIGEWTKDKDARELMDDLQNAGVPAGVVQSQSDLWEDPQLQASRASSNGWSMLSVDRCRTMG